MPDSKPGLGTKNGAYYFSPLPHPPNSYSSPHFSPGENKMLNLSVSFGVTVRFFCQASWEETSECMRIMPKPFRGKLSGVPSTWSHLASQTPSPISKSKTSHIYAKHPGLSPPELQGKPETPE